jgi:flagellin-like protein
LLWRFGRKGVSPIIVAVLLVVVIVAGTLLGFIFLSGLSTGFRPSANTGLSSTISAHVYFSDARVDVLNRIANFSIVMANTVATPQVGDIELTVGNRIVQTLPFSLGAGEARTIQISQKLNQTGIWTLKITSNGIKANSYTFTVVETQDEADYATTQWESENFYRNLTLICYVLSIIAFAVAIASLARQPKPLRLE